MAPPHFGQLRNSGVNTRPMTALAARTGAVNLGQGFPDEDETIDSASKVLDAMFAGKDKVEADLTIANGAVLIGIIPVAVLPPL